MTGPGAARRSRLIAAGVLLVTLAAACGIGPATTKPTSTTVVDGHRVIWAQGSTIHVGDRVVDAGGRVQGLAPTPRGVVVTLTSGAYILDGNHRTALPGDPSAVATSADGRLVGWIDFHGPRRAAGQVAKIVIADARTARVLHETSRGMGGAKVKGGDLGEAYDELRPTFLGFDEHAAYWSDISRGTGTDRRWDLRTHRTTVVERSGARGNAQGDWPSSGNGTEGAVEGGRFTQGTGSTGFRSPDRRWVVETGEEGALPVYDADAHRVTPHYTHRFQWFGAWLGADRYFVLARDHDEDTIAAPGHDHTRGWLSVCTLPSGSCHDLRAVSATQSLLLPYGTLPH